MKRQLGEIQPLLAENRTFLMGAGVSDAASTGAGYDQGLAIQIQDDLKLEPYTTFWAGSGRNLVTMGAFSYTHSVLPMCVKVGRYTSIGSNMKVLGARHPKEWASTSPVFYNQKLLMQTFAADHGVELMPQSYDYEQGPISIGHDVWIGDDVTLGHGVTIGDGAVIAAGSLVLEDVEPYTIVGGHPARKIDERMDWEASDALTESRWWRFSPAEIGDIDASDPLAFAKEVIFRAQTLSISPYSPAPLAAAELAPAE